MGKIRRDVIENWKKTDLARDYRERGEAFKEAVRRIGASP